MTFKKRFIFLPFIALLTGFLFFLIYQEVEEQTIHEFNQQQMTIAKQTAKGIEELFDDYYSEAQYLSTGKNIINLNEKGIDEIKRHFESHKETIKAITRVDKSGRIIYTYPYNENVIGLDISYQEHMKQILKTQKPVISDVFFAVQNYNTIAYHVPIVKNNKFNGTLAILIPFNKIANEYLSKISLKKTGYAWLISGKGVELFCKNTEHIGKSIFANAEENKSVIAVINKMIKGEEGTSTYFRINKKYDSLEGIKVHAAYCPIKFSNSHWSICIATPEKEVLEAMTGFRNKLIIIIIFVSIVGMIFTYFFVKAWIILSEENKRKMAENDLRLSEVKFRLLTENQTEVIFSISPIGKLLYVSPNIKEFGGYIPDEEIGGQVEKYMPIENEIKFLLKEINNMVVDHKPRIAEFMYKPKDNSPFPVEVSAKPVLEDGLVNKINCVMKNVSQRKRAEEKLEESEERFRSIVENSHDGIIIVDENFRFIYVNKEFCEILGYREEELLNTTFQTYLEERSKKQVIENYIKRQKGEEAPQRYEAELIRKSGEIRTIEISSIVIVNTKGQKQTIAQLLDITEKKQAELALKESEKKFRELSDLLPQIIYETDIKGNLTFVNKKAFEYFGYTKNEFENGLLATDMLLPKERERAIQNITNSINGKSNGPNEYMAQRKDGTNFPILIYSNPIFEDNKPAGLRGIIVDITDIKKSEEALRKSEEQFRSYIDNAPDGIIVINKNYGLVDINTAICTDTGFSKIELIKMNFKELIDELDNTNMIEFFTELDSVGKSMKDLTYIKKSGEKRFWTIDAVKLNKNEYLGFVKDITERKMLEDQLRQSQKMEAVGHLAGGVAHDFNNILTIINGYGEMLLNSLSDQQSQYEDVKQILKAGNRAESLTRQLLAFSRKQIMQPKVLDLNQLIKDLDKMLRRLISENIEIIIEYDNHLKYIKADPGQMEQVILNLAINSGDAMPKGGKLKIKTSNDSIDKKNNNQYPELEIGTYVKLEVSDTGVGIDKETLSKIYDPFFTTKSEGKGTGLGLSTVYGIVKQSGGSIFVSSETGIGTSFEIFIKAIIQDLDEEIVPIIHESNLSGNETILVVEDEKSVRNIAVATLKQSGYNVISADGSNEVYDVVKSSSDQPDLLLTDVVMPDESGHEIAQKLKKEIENLKVVYMSGYTNDAIVNQGVLQENLDFIQKPFTPKILLQKIREVLDKN